MLDRQSILSEATDSSGYSVGGSKSTFNQLVLACRRRRPIGDRGDKLLESLNKPLSRR
jgi:hypothetical protein